MGNKIVCLFVGLFLLLVAQVSSAKSCGDKAQFNCMVAAINGEARGEGYKGMLMVGKALKTRKLRGYVGKSICGIAKQSFAPKSLARTGTKGTARANIIKAAKAACKSGDAGYTHFHSFRNKNATSWARKFQYKGKVGGHHLFNAPRGIKAHFNEVIAFEQIINDANFMTDLDVYFYEATDQEAFDYYTEADDQDVEQILSQPIDNSISI